MTRAKDMRPCPHPLWTVPTRMPIKAEGSQEIVGEATLQVCCECGHVKGHVSNGSLLNPSVKLPIEFPGDADIGTEARKALKAILVPANPPLGHLHRGSKRPPMPFPDT